MNGARPTRIDIRGSAATYEPRRVRGTAPEKHRIPHRPTADRGISEKRRLVDGAASEVFAMVATFVCPPAACATEYRVAAVEKWEPITGITIAFGEACPTELCMTSRPSYGECGGLMG
jgi:hypothetical protein